MLKITATNIERMKRAVDEDLELDIQEKPNVLVHNNTGDDKRTHVVDVVNKECSCSDYEYNCNRGEYCKHIWFIVFKRSGIL